MKKCIFSFILVIILLLSPITVATSGSAESSVGTTYYVDSAYGSDDNNGLSESSAWRTLSKISASTFSQGDKILLKRGSVFDGECVNLKGNGTAENPVILGAYGSDERLPLINAGGQKYAVQIKNQSNIVVENLEITNISTVGDRFYNGVYIAASGTYNSYKNITIRNNNIHDLTCAKSSHIENGNTVYTEEGAAIFLRGDNYTTDFSNVIIENNIITDVRGNGIYFNGGYNRTASKLKGYGINNIVRNNYLENIGYDGILMCNCNGALIEYNVVNRSHNVSTAAEVAIWPFASDNCIFQFNEAYNTQTASDGQGFDCDYQCVGTVFQYNYGHDNVGGFMLICTEDRFRPNGGNGVDAYNEDAVIRYNISQNNGNRQFQLLGHIKNTKIYNNTIATRWGISAVAVNTYKKNATYTSSEFEGTRPDFPINTQFINNLFYDFSSYPTGSYVSKYSFESGNSSNVTGYTTDTVWDNNLVYGRHSSQSPTSAKVAADGTVIIKSAENNLNTDPMLLDPFSATIGLDTCDGYQLLEGSPAIGAGKIIENNGGRDFFGNPVYANQAPNIGAYQGKGVKDTSTKIYYDGNYKTLVDWEENKVGATNGGITNIGYVYTGTDGTLKVTDDTTKLLSSIGSKKGLVLVSNTNSPQINMSFITSDIKNSKAMRIYANGDGNSYSASILINSKFKKSVTIPADGGFLMISPGDKVYSNEVYKYVELTEENYKSISSLQIVLSSANGKTVYFDDIQLDMTENIETENVLFIPVDTNPGAETSSLVPKEPETIDKTGEKYTVAVDGVQYELTYYDLFTLPANNSDNFIAYTNGKILFNAGDTVRITDNIQFTSLNLNAVMLNGAAVRLNSMSGIRFYMNTDVELIESLINKGAGIEFGTLIAPQDLLNGEDLTHNLDNSENMRFVDVKYAAKDKYFIENNKPYIVGSIVNIRESNINRCFVGRGYITVKFGTTVKTVYADYYNNDILNNSRSIAYVSYLLQKDELKYRDLNSIQKATVDYYASKHQQN